jgi:hypothetical protein
MRSAKIVRRFEDTSRYGKLEVFLCEDESIIVEITDDFHFPVNIEFYKEGSGGGDSPHTHAALINLFNAMVLDNSERLQFRGGPDEERTT